MYTKVENLSRGSVCVQTLDSDVTYYCFNNNKLIKEPCMGVVFPYGATLNFCKSFSKDLHNSGMNYHFIRLSCAVMPLFILLFISYCLLLFRFLPS
jgi:hypothetical protein